MTAAGWDRVAWAVLAPLAEAALRTFVLTGIVAAGLALLRVKRAAVRLCAWTVVLYAALGIGMFGRFAPSIDVPVPAIGIFAHRAGAAPPRVEPGHPSDIRAVAGSTAMGASSRPADRPAIEGWGRAALVLSLLFYLLGVGWLLLRLGAGWVVTRRLEQRARAIHAPAVLARLAQLAAAAGLAAPPRLAESDRLYVPMTTSVLRPVILLPADWRGWNAAKLQAVLSHELAHVGRRDVLTQRLALAYRAVFWVSPISWWLHHQLAELAEQASDEAALGGGIDRATYAEALVDFFSARPMPARRAHWHVAMARGGDLSAERRVEHVLAWDGARQIRVKLVAFVTILAVSPLLAVAAALRPEPLPVGAFELPDAPVPPQEPFAALSLTARPPGATEIALSDLAPIRRADENAAPPVTVRVQPHSAIAGSSQGAESTIAPLVLPPASDPERTPPPIEPAPAPPAAAPAPSASAPERISQPKTDAEPAPAARPPVLSGDIQDPTLVHRVEAKYTTAAMQAKIQGVVWLDVVVLPDGKVGDVKLVRSLDPVFGLDDKAIEAAKNWTFRPGTRSDPNTNQRVPVATVARLELEFRLH